MTSVVWDDSSATWLVSTKDGLQVRSRFVITAVGLLSASNIPALPGIENFAGRTFHTAYWPHETVVFTARRVAVIGTGSSGIQVIPEVAEQASQLTVFQRTANFSIPANNRPLTAREIARAKTERDFIRETSLKSLTGLLQETLRKIDLR